MKRINALTSKKMYMFTLFKKDLMFILVCISIVIPSKLLNAAEHIHLLLNQDDIITRSCQHNDGHLSALRTCCTWKGGGGRRGVSLWIFSIIYLTMEIVFGLRLETNSTFVLF